MFRREKTKAHDHGGYWGHKGGHHGDRFARGERSERDAGGEHRGGHHGRPGGGPFGRGGRGGGLSRFFAHGDLRLVVLNLIAEKPRHGYEIIKAIEERVGGAYSPSPGVIYPTLTFLEELSYVNVGAEDAGKKLYTITPDGQGYLEANRTTLNALLARMDEAVKTHGRGAEPQIVRGMENVKLALKLRLSRGALTDDQVNAVTAALDAAATAIERV